MPDSSSATDSTTGPEGTRLALIEAGLGLFGAKGYAATSIRQLAAEAGANVAAIAYHFGGKAGLRQACAEAFVARVAARLAPPPDHPAASPDPAAARAALHAVLGRMVEFLLSGPAAARMVPFVLREIAEDGEATALIYARLIEPTHRRLCALWSTATGQEAEAEAVRLAVFAMLGQALYFRIGAPVVRRRMGWEMPGGGFGPAEVQAVRAVLAAHLDAMLDAASNAAGG